MPAPTAKRLMERYGGDQGKGRRRRIGGPDPHERADVQIARRGRPDPALAPLAAALPLGAQPETLGRSGRGARDQVVIGRAGFGDRFDPGQWPPAMMAGACGTAGAGSAIDAAAALVTVSSGAMAR